MAEIWFYHLTERKLEEALPSLVDKCVERGWRAAIQMRDPALMDRLDTLLWTFREDSFLPHGLDTGEMPEDQPVLLTTSPENRNQAAVRILIDGATPPDLTPYTRAVFMFDGYDHQQVEAARAEWKKLKGEGHALTYWQQTSEGRWEKKATG